MDGPRRGRINPYLLSLPSAASITAAHTTIPTAAGDYPAAHGAGEPHALQDGGEPDLHGRNRFRPRGQAAEKQGVVGWRWGERRPAYLS